MDATPWLSWSPNATSFLESLLMPFVALSAALTLCLLFSFLLLIIRSSSRVHSCSFFVFFLLLCKWQVLCKYFLDYGIMSIWSTWVGWWVEGVFCLAPGGLEGMCFYQEGFRGQVCWTWGQSVWNVSNGKWGKKVHGDKGTISCNPRLQWGTGK